MHIYSGRSLHTWCNNLDIPRSRSLWDERARDPERCKGKFEFMRDVARSHVGWGCLLALAGRVLGFTSPPLMVEDSKGSPAVALLQVATATISLLFPLV